MSPKNSSLAFDDIKEQALEEFVPELNVIVNKRHQANQASLLSSGPEIVRAAVEIRGMLTVSF